MEPRNTGFEKLVVELAKVVLFGALAIAAWSHYQPTKLPVHDGCRCEPNKPYRTPDNRRGSLGETTTLGESK